MEDLLRDTAQLRQEQGIYEVSGVNKVWGLMPGLDFEALNLEFEFKRKCISEQIDS